MLKWFPVALLLITGCVARQKISSTAPASPSPLINDGKIWSSLFQQRAAEYKALCLQAFSIARDRVDEALEKTYVRPIAIVTDIDETFLDNSPYAVHQALQGKGYDPATWMQWTARGMADTLPGALGFFQYAAKRGIEIFYITNREMQEQEGTLQNLRRFGFPYADAAHLLLRTAESGKEARRQEVMKKYHIFLLLGDNLSDFSDLFDKKNEQDRDAAVMQLQSEFGRRFIILPNFNYGGWEDALFQHRRDWTDQQRDSLVRQAVKGY
ncbi:MAG TPA: 5'-nucleotidase, lipoprotein e(P4) family [Chitinophagaceae bacterium]|nr:5'-nucleotidase, lipoprotein e(P4) family [Chitinophagaceae bacterium]